MEENPESLNFRRQRLISNAQQGKRAEGTAPIRIQAQGLLKVLLHAKDVIFVHEEESIEALTMLPADNPLPK